MQIKSTIQSTPGQMVDWQSTSCVGFWIWVLNGLISSHRFCTLPVFQIVIDGQQVPLCRLQLCPSCPWDVPCMLGVWIGLGLHYILCIVSPVLYSSLALEGSDT